MRLAIIWHRLGPYHLARLRGAAAVGDGQLLAVELSGRDRSYAWDKAAGAEGFERITLFPDRDCDTLPPARVRRRLKRALDALRPDVVCIPSWGTNYAAAALSWCLRTSTPSTVMLASSRQDKLRVPWKEGVKGALARRFQSGIVGGSRQADYLHALGLPRERIWTGYDVVDNDYFASGADAARREEDSARRRLGLPKRYFLSVCRFISKKNVPTLLEGFARFANAADAGGGTGGGAGGDTNRWDLVLLGDGPLRGEFEQAVAELGLSGRVHLPGFKQYPELPTYYGLAGAFVLPSVEEQWGLVVNEAMASGLPVLVSRRCGCAPDLVREGETGFTFDPSDAGALAVLMGRLARDPASRERMGRSAREVVSAWGPEAFGRNLWGAAAAAVAAAPQPRHSLASRLILPALVRRRNSLAA